MISIHTQPSHSSREMKNIDFELVKRTAEMLGVSVRDVLAAGGRTAESVRMSRPPVREATVRTIIQRYEYHIALGDEPYIVVSSRDITRDYETRFKIEYFDKKHNMVYDSGVTKLLYGALMDEVHAKKRKREKRSVECN